jgi:hypothetical protein
MDKRHREALLLQVRLHPAFTSLAPCRKSLHPDCGLPGRYRYVAALGDAAAERTVQREKRPERRAFLPG